MKNILTLVIIGLCINVNAQNIRAVSWDKIIADVGRESKSVKSKVVQVGDQTWMTQNVDVTTFRNGDPILDANGNGFKWQQAGLDGTPAWCYAMEGHPEFGKLYNSFAINDPRGLAPEGWHVPTVDDWNTLYNYLGGNNNVLNKISGKVGWLYPSSGATNSTGLTMRPTGWRNATGSMFNLGDRICLWAANDNDGCEMFTFFDITSYQQNKREMVSTNDCRYGAGVRFIMNR